MNVPAPHAAHGPPSGPVYPALHIQSIPASLPTALMEFAGQFTHAALPVSTLNFPATHAVHAPPSAPVKPAAHLQFVKASLPGGESEPAGHLAHASEPLFCLYTPAGHAVHGPPSAPEYPRWHRHAAASVWAVSACPELAGQAVQAAEPLFSLYAPAGHALHGPPSGPV